MARLAGKVAIVSSAARVMGLPAGSFAVEGSEAGYLAGAVRLRDCGRAHDGGQANVG